MSVFTAENLKLIGGTEWRHPSTGEVRIYINDLAELYGLETSHYKTGNISSATLDGERISNSEAGRILCRLRSAKIWLAGDGHLMKRDLSDSDFEAIKAALTSKIEAAIADQANNPAPTSAPDSESAHVSADAEHVATFDPDMDAASVRDAVRAAGVDAYTQNDYLFQRSKARDVQKFGEHIAREGAQKRDEMHARFPILASLDAYLTANGK